MTIAAPKSDPVLSLNRYLCADMMNAEELRRMARLARTSKLTKLADSCFYALSELSTMSSYLTTPIYPDLRFIHSRTADLVSFSFPFYNIRDWVIGEDHISPTIQDLHKYFSWSWKLIVRVDEDSEGERQIGFHIQMIASHHAMEKQWVIQLFASDYHNRRFHTTSKELKLAVRSYGLKRFASWNKLREEILFDFDDAPIVFGATIYVNNVY